MCVCYVLLQSSSLTKNDRSHLPCGWPVFVLPNLEAVGTCRYGFSWRRSSQAASVADLTIQRTVLHGRYINTAVEASGTSRIKVEERASGRKGKEGYAEDAPQRERESER